MSPFSIRASGSPVEQHVHLADCPGPEVLLLSVKGEIARIASLSLDVVGALDQHAAGAGGRVADAHPLGGSEQFNDQFDHHPWRVELAALLASVVGKLLDQVFVGPAEEVGLGHAVVAKRDLGEVLDQAREHGVAVLTVPELPLVVVVDARQYAFERAVFFFQPRTGYVQGLADVGGLPLDRAPACQVGNKERVLVRVAPSD